MTDQNYIGNINTNTVGEISGNKLSNEFKFTHGPNHYRHVIGNIVLQVILYLFANLKFVENITLEIIYNFVQFFDEFFFFIFSVLSPSYW